MENLKFKGKYFFELIRNNKVIKEKVIENHITDSALSSIISNYFDNGSPSSNLYIGLILSGDVSEPNIDTLTDLFSTCVENENYSGNRRLWIPSVVNHEVSNINNKVEFLLNQNTDIMGIFLCGVESKAIKTGFLFSTAVNLDFGLLQNDIIKLSYKITTQSA